MIALRQSSPPPHSRKIFFSMSQGEKMKRALWMFIAFAFLLAFGEGVVASPRAWVSAEIGVDVGTCTRMAPCRTFDYAVAQVDPGGEVDVLDSGGFGPITITKSVTISAAPGLFAAIIPTGYSAIVVNAGVGDVVVLRGLTITGNATSIGINAVQFGQLHIERLTMQAAGAVPGSVGIEAYATAHPAIMTITDTLVRDHGYGVRLHAHDGPTAGSLTATIESVRVHSNGVGIGLVGGTRATLLNVVSSGNETGLEVWGLSVDQPSIVVERSALVGNTKEGLKARSDGADMSVTLSANTISGNGTGVAMLASIPGHLFVYSRGNNTFAQNSSDVIGGSLTTLTAK